MDLIDVLLGAAFFFALFWLGSGLWGFVVARSRGGNPAHWAAYALFLGPLGLLLAFKLSYPCPHCSAEILRALRTCPCCSQPLPQLSDEENPKGSFWSYRRSW